jgi:hypothetical protein
LLPLWLRAASRTQPGLARQALGRPRVAVVEVGDHRLEEFRGDAADRAQLVDGGQVDRALADELLRAVGELEDLHPRGHALLGPPERLGGAILGQAAVEHRPHGLGLLVGVELLARDVRDGTVGVFRLGVADHDRHVGQPE